MKKKLKILLCKKCINIDVFLKAFVNYFQVKGIDIDIIQKNSKYNILNLLKIDKDFDAVVLDECMQNEAPIKINFINELRKEVPESKFIFIISNNHKDDRDYLEDIYSNRIYNVFFSKDATSKNIANAVLNRQQPEIVKSYLGLDNKAYPKIRQEQLKDIIEYLKSYKNKNDLHSRYNLISKKFNPEKNTYILSQLPKNIIEKLEGNAIFDRNKVKIDEPQSLKNHIKIREKIITREKVIKKEVVKRIYDIPKDYKKVIAVFGFENSGVTTIATNLAYFFSKKKIKTTLIDTDFKKKDIYYHFDKDYVGCLSLLDEIEDFREIGQVINENLMVFSEHRDKEVSLKEDTLLRLISSSKKNSDIVIIDLSINLDEKLVNRILNYSDNILFITTQNINSLYRINKELFNYKDKLNSLELVINKYVKGIKYLDEKSISKNFFREIKLNNESFEVDINQVFSVSEDLRSILQGLASRIPGIDLSDNKFINDIEEIANYYYQKNRKKTSVFNRLFGFGKS